MTQRPTPGTLYRFPPQARAHAEATVTALGYRPFPVSLQACHDKAGVLQQFARTLAFPAWFGHNWDALADCLGDLSWLPVQPFDGQTNPPGIALILVDCTTLAHTEPDTLATLLDILDELTHDATPNHPAPWALVEADSGHPVTDTLPELPGDH
ncbi:MAG: barstar family protein [Rhodocyclaceae bacterium]